MLMSAVFALALLIERSSHFDACSLQLRYAQLITLTCVSAPPTPKREHLHICNACFYMCICIIYLYFLLKYDIC